MRPKTKKALLFYSILMFSFLYVPIIILMVYSFNDSKTGTTWTGFTFDWYVQLFSNDQIINATVNSILIAVITTLISCVLGTFASLALYRYKFPGKKFFDFIFYIPVVIPHIVVAVALLSVYGWLDLNLGIKTVIPGHVALTTSYVIFVVMARLYRFDPAIEEAAKDLGANEWKTFWKVTFPLIFPGILAGALLVFTISLDEFNISFFNTGPGSNTLPVLIYSMVRKGITPEINALSTIMILFIVVMALIIGKGMGETSKSKKEET
jgi:spermidine/putrescine transport system permease protein